MSTLLGRIRDAVDRSRLMLLAASKRARRIRTASEFDARMLVPTLRSPVVPSSAWTWSLEDVMRARDAQQIGQFVSAVRLAESLRTDDAAYTATQNRLAPERCIGVQMRPGKGTSAGRICNEADALFGPDGVGMKPATLADINRTLADHGIAIGVNVWTPRADGSRVDVELKSWPLEFVFWHSAARCLVTRVDPQPMVDSVTLPGMPADRYGNPQLGSTLVPIIHGDGRWVVFQKSDFMPWRQDAAILSAAMVYAAHAFAIRDWSKNSATHGSAKVVGELPEGFDLDIESPHVLKFMQLLEDIAASETPYGVKPFGSKIEIMASQSRMHEVFAELALNREKALHRVYCGTDAALGAQGGAPGIDVEQLFGVSTTIVQGDLRCIDRGVFEGTISPWTAINHGDSSQAPHREYLVPDTDAGIRADQKAKQQTAYIAALCQLQAAGIQPTQAMADDLAADYDARPLKLPPAPVSAPAQQPAAPAPALTDETGDFAQRQASFLADLAEYRANGLLVDQSTVTKLAATYKVPAPRLNGSH